MGINVSYTVTCDRCGVDTGSSKATLWEALEYAEAGDWEVQQVWKETRAETQILCSGCRYLAGEPDE